MTAFIFKPSNEFYGKVQLSDTSELHQKLQAFRAAKGPIPAYSYIEAEGRTWTICDSESLELVEGRHLHEKPQSDPRRNTPSEATHCYVHTAGERRGPYLPEQIRAMWQNGHITADATVSWESAAEPLPINDLLMMAPARGVAETTSTSGITILGTTMLVGGLIGLFYYWQLFDSTVSSYGGRIHNIGLMQERQTGLIISGIASILGFVCILVDRVSAKRSD